MTSLIIAVVGFMGIGAVCAELSPINEVIKNLKKLSTENNCKKLQFEIEVKAVKYDIAIHNDDAETKEHPRQQGETVLYLTFDATSKPAGAKFYGEAYLRFKDGNTKSYELYALSLMPDDMVKAMKANKEVTEDMKLREVNILGTKREDTTDAAAFVKAITPALSKKESKTKLACLTSTGTKVSL